MPEKQNNPMVNQLLEARDSLKKLPILGPAIWLYARDERKKYTFIADQDWLLIPPIILDQCKLYTRDEIPWAFATWALVNDEVDVRLRGANPKIAPHEWQSGSHIWVMDIVAPFGDTDTMIEDLRRNVFGGSAISLLQSYGDGRVVAQDYPAIGDVTANK